MKNFIATYCKKLQRKKMVTSIESMTLTVRGMRGGSVYEIAHVDGKIELRCYRELFSSEENRLELEKSTRCDTQALIELMNHCGVIRWDGFHGKHPRNVHDGILFNFNATINGGQMIRANGSANFPKGYHEFMRELNDMLAE